MCAQLLPPAEKRGELSLVEVGPRCCLNPIRVFAGSFGGPVIYENASFVSPDPYDNPDLGSQPEPCPGRPAPCILRILPASATAAQNLPAVQAHQAPFA